MIDGPVHCTGMKHWKQKLRISNFSENTCLCKKTSTEIINIEPCLYFSLILTSCKIVGKHSPVVHLLRHDELTSARAAVHLTHPSHRHTREHAWLWPWVSNQRGCTQGKTDLHIKNTLLLVWFHTELQLSTSRHSICSPSRQVNDVAGWQLLVLVTEKVFLLSLFGSMFNPKWLNVSAETYQNKPKEKVLESYLWVPWTS